MSAGQFVGRVGGIAAALGVGMAIFGGTAVAVADTTGPDTRGSATASADAAPAPARSSRAAVRSDARPAPERARTRAVAAVAAPRVSTLSARASNTVTLPAPAVTLPTPSAAVEPAPTYVATPPNPQSTIDTPYGRLGQWMINKAGAVANWVDLPYCGQGSTKANCKPDTPGAKTMQEPINTVFVVKAGNKYVAELKLDLALRAAGFGPSPFSSIGYKAILGTNTAPQMPHGGLLGLGFLPPLPFGLGQNGLLSLVGLGAAYRDAPFWGENSHLRTFGGEPDGNGNYIFTASVSEENLDATGGGLLPTHGFESYNVARDTLLNQLVARSKITGASNLGMIAMNNAISPDDPTYTTGDADGLAQVIAIGSMVGSSPARPINPTRPYRPARSLTAV
ncbi:MAG: hypothetical protein NT146_17365 [Mycobacterium sp.]|nr:hypothetical protein [Mycobacterium sp.]